MIGERLRKLRKEKSLSQKELAGILGTSQGYISDIEKDIKKPGTDFLISLKRFLKVDLDWFLTGEESPGSTLGNFLVMENQDADYRNTPTVIKIIKMLEGLDDDAQWKVLAYVEEQELLRQLKQQLKHKK